MFKSIFHNHLPEWVALLTVTIWGTNFAFQKALLGESFTPLKLAGAALALAGMLVARRTAGGGRQTADRGPQTAGAPVETVAAGAG